MHGTVQVSLFSFEPKGEGKARLYFVWEVQLRYHKPPSNEIRLLSDDFH